MFADLSVLFWRSVCHRGGYFLLSCQYLCKLKQFKRRFLWVDLNMWIASQGEKSGYSPLEVILSGVWTTSHDQCLPEHLMPAVTSLGKKKRAVLLRAGTGYSPVLHQALKWCLTRTNKKNDGLDVYTWETAGEVCGEAELNFFIIRYYTFTISSLGVIIPYLFLSKELNHPLESNRKIMFSHH